MADPTPRLHAALADRYRLGRELGQGGMATVYLAEDLKHHRQVAVKVLRPDLAATMGSDRFAREIEVAARLQHPHILPLHDSGEADGFFYYVMPYVEGETLRDRLARSGELPVTEAVRLVSEIAEALAAAHQRGVAHRDIKPENILLSGRHAVVMDFGIAKAVTEATGRQQLTTAGVALGTPAYMAPEQATADPQLDHRVDIYALGVVAYEMLTGRPPFHGLTPQQTLAAHVTQTPAPVGERRPGVSPALDSVVMKCLAKRPADRFQTAEELVTALEPLATPSVGMTPTTTRPLEAAKPRSRLGRVAGIASVVVLLVLLGWMALKRAATWSVRTGQTAPVTNDPGLEIDPALSPDGTLLAYAAGPPLATRIYIRQVDGGRPVAIGDSAELGQRRPKWSPDGSRILYAAAERLVVAPALGGPARTVARTDRPLAGGDWSPNGEELVFVSHDSVLVASVNGSATRLLRQTDDLHSPAWSPDGRLIALVRGNASYIITRAYGNAAVSSLVLVPSDGGEPVPVGDRTSLVASPAWMPDSRTLLFVSDRGGSRDVHAVRVSPAGRVVDAPQQVTTGLRPHSISLDRSGRRMAYNLYTPTANIWSVDIPRKGMASASDVLPVTRGNQVIESLSISADGRWIYYDSDRTGRFELYRAPIAGGEPTQLTDIPGGNFLPAPSLDGRELAFQSQRNGSRDIFVMPADGGAAEPVFVGPGSDNGPKWLADGRRVGFFHSGGDDLANGAYVTEWSGSAWSAPQPLAQWGAVAPDGRTLLRIHSDTVVQWSIEGGHSRLLWSRRDPSEPEFRSATFSPDGTRIYLLGVAQLARAEFGIWTLPAGGGVPHEIVRFDDPYRLPLRGTGLGTDGNRLYLVLDERQSDVWVAAVKIE